MTACSGRDTVALVTGARRGIGHATAEALAARGLRVAITSRSGMDDPSLTGVLSELRRVAQQAGGDAMAVAMDLSDRPSIASAVREVAEEWGHVSVLVNNALCDRPGSQATIDSIDFDAFEAMIVGEVVNTTYLTTQVLAVGDPAGVTVVNVGSGAAEHVPAQPVGRGGWAYSYSASKAALHRLAPFLQLEHGRRGVRAFTVDPGYVRTEALLERLGDVEGSVPPAVPAEVIAWLALDPAADAHQGRRVRAQELAARLGPVVK